MTAKTRWEVLEQCLVKSQKLRGWVKWFVSFQEEAVLTCSHQTGQSLQLFCFTFRVTWIVVMYKPQIMIQNTGHYGLQFGLFRNGPEFILNHNL